MQPESKISRRAWLLVVAAGATAACASPAAAPSPAAPATSQPPTAVAPKAASPADSKPQSPGATQAPAAAKPGAPTGKVIFGEDASLTKVYEPGTGNSGQALHFFWQSFDGLTWMAKDGRVMPGLASEWRNTDERTWVFTLGDYKFHNGRAVTVEDIVETAKRYRNPENKIPVATAYVSVDAIEPVDAKTIRITTKYPDPTLPNLMSLPMILPMQEFTQMGAEAFTRQPIGTGPFRVEQADFTSALRYTAMGPDFKSPRGTPNVKDIEIRFIGESAARAAAIQTGEVDVAFPLLEDQIPALQAAGLNIVRQSATSTAHFLLDPVNGPTKDVRVRQAINYAVDKETIIKQLYNGNARVDQQLIGPGCLGFNPDLKPYPFDRAKARQLLAEAGYANGFQVPMTAINVPAVSKEVAEVVAAQLQQVGIQTNIEVREVAVWVQEYYGPRERRPGIWAEVINWDQTFEPNSTWRWFSSDIAVNGGRRWDDEQFDKLYQQAKNTFDRARRDALYKEAGKYLFEQAPVLYLWQGASPGATKKEISWDPDLIATRYDASLKRA